MEVTDDACTGAAEHPKAPEMSIRAESIHEVIGAAKVEVFATQATLKISCVIMTASKASKQQESPLYSDSGYN